MQIALIALDIRSTHNVGSLFRTCDGLGVDTIYLTGITPYPKGYHDDRLPHIADKLHKDIHKTALGAEDTVRWEYRAHAPDLLAQLKAEGWYICALEQSDDSVMLPDFRPTTQKIALILGTEVTGIPKEILDDCDTTIEIPMHGSKESFNVSVAAGIALYVLKTFSR